MTVREAFSPVLVAAEEQATNQRRSAPKISTIRQKVQKLPSITSSHRYFTERIEGFHDAINTTFWLATVSHSYPGHSPLPDGERDMAVRFASYQTARNLSRRIMNPSAPGDTTYAIALWEQLTTMAHLTSDVFSDIQSLALHLKHNIERYFREPAKLGFVSENEQRGLTRRFGAIREVKPRSTFQL